METGRRGDGGKGRCVARLFGTSVRGACVFTTALGVPRLVSIVSHLTFEAEPQKTISQLPVPRPASPRPASPSLDFDIGHIPCSELLHKLQYLFMLKLWIVCFDYKKEPIASGERKIRCVEYRMIRLRQLV